jgi:RNA polymerase sigma-70 factor (ECF subfamily)
MVLDHLTGYRSYLALLAGRCIGRQLRRKLNSSDLVQNTLLRLAAAGEAFLALPDGQRLAYVRRCLRNEVCDQRRRFFAEKRNIALERSLDELVDGSSVRLELWLAADNSTPSEQAIKSERLLRLADAIASLPPEQREAFELKHLQGLTLQETASVMGKQTVAQVAGLLRRATKTLRHALEEA